MSEPGNVERNIAGVRVADVGRILEPEFIRRFGEQEYHRLYRTISLQLQENVLSQEGQVLCALTLLGRSTERTNIFLVFVWLSKKDMTDPGARELLQEIRQRTCADVLWQARQAVKSER